MENPKYIIYNNNKYVMFPIKYKSKIVLPVLLDYDDYKQISKLNKNWRCNNNGFVVCSHTVNGITKDVYLHEIIVLLNNTNPQNKKIYHSNKIGLDNRKENLIFGNGNINTKKKKRTIVLPPNCGINADDIPTYVWYVAGNDKHGDKFIVKIDDVSYSTTTSKYVSINDKLDDARMFLKMLFIERNDLRLKYSMNGDLNGMGQELCNSYYNIINKIGYSHIKKPDQIHHTNDLLK